MVQGMVGMRDGWLARVGAIGGGDHYNGVIGIGIGIGTRAGVGVVGVGARRGSWVPVRAYGAAVGR